MNQTMNLRIQALSPSLLPPIVKLYYKGICPCLRLSLEAFANSRLSRTSLVARCSLGWPKTPSEGSSKHLSQLGALVASGSQGVQTSALVGNDKIGVLLLNLGGPKTLDDVQLFLFNLFADPDIIQLPRLFHFLQKPL